jgi:hypothetical protein
MVGSAGRVAGGQHRTPVDDHGDDGQQLPEMQDHSVAEPGLDVSVQQSAYAMTALRDPQKRIHPFSLAQTTVDRDSYGPAIRGRIAAYIAATRTKHNG